MKSIKILKQMKAYFVRTFKTQWTVGYQLVDYFLTAYLELLVARK